MSKVIIINGEPIEEVLNSAKKQNCDKVVAIVRTPIQVPDLDYIVTDENHVSVALKTFGDYDFIYFQNNTTVLNDDCLDTLERYHAPGSFSDFFIISCIGSNKARIEYLESIVTDFNIGHNLLIETKHFKNNKYESFNDLINKSGVIFTHIPVPTYTYVE